MILFLNSAHLYYLRKEKKKWLLDQKKSSIGANCGGRGQFTKHFSTDG